MYKMLYTSWMSIPIVEGDEGELMMIPEQAFLNKSIDLIDRIPEGSCVR